MRVLLSGYGSHGDFEPMVGFAGQAGALGTATEECDGPTATGMMPTGGCR